VTTVEALADMTPEQLEAIEGIGPKTVEKISLAVNNYFSSLEPGEAAGAVPAEEAEAPAEAVSEQAASATEAAAEATEPAEVAAAPEEATAVEETAGQAESTEAQEQPPGSEDKQ
jgi:N utilization substance protein A